MCLKILGVLQCVKLEQEKKFEHIVGIEIQYGGFLRNMGNSYIV